MQDLSDCELFIEGIGADKISDITTNVIRRQLIAYTQRQCVLHGIPTQPDVPSGWLWDGNHWQEQYTALPVINDRKLLLVPKGGVRWSLSFSHQKYYRRFVLEFLQTQHLQQNSALVEVVRGHRRVTKRVLEQAYPPSKRFLADFTAQHPQVLANYKALLDVEDAVTDAQLMDDYDESAFATSLRQALAAIAPGQDAATAFHSLSVGILEFLLYPNIINPVKEREINQGRKRIDIVFTNAGQDGFFFRMARDVRTHAAEIVVECKNYSGDVANEEIDQILTRFGPARGHFGLLLSRTLQDRNRCVQRCRDAAIQQQGFVLPLVDADLNQLLGFVESRQRDRIEPFLDARMREVSG